MIVVACEDTHAVKQYFAKFRTKRIQYKVLATEDGNSSPRAVLDRLDQFNREYATEENDELWVCIDADHWISGNHQRALSEVLRECRQKGYRVAISNPCFEVWLLLHFAELTEREMLAIIGKSDTESMTDDERSALRCAAFEERLRALSNGYNKSNICGLSLTPSQVAEATQRAKGMDTENGDIPRCPGTRVYLLIDTLLAKETIDLS